ncbi:hypothetical protein PT287_09740 [Lactobacillus sp. ESL0679]|uniref:hypothetical protein n=1 Tax=Lactobacillus sp. ESL0679 TaxID=2983209 RepID=UPI0023F974C5|nr:hypothetical protein [Lactobacillus sp. ESL0679]MDF7683779.1 hypothetical protein [Lactobacillus sp. ESL0679]
MEKEVMTEELKSLHKWAGQQIVLITFAMGLFAGTFYGICSNSKVIYTEAKNLAKLFDFNKNYHFGWIWFIIIIVIAVYAALGGYQLLANKICNAMYSYKCLLNKECQKQYILQVLNIKSRIETVFFSGAAIFSVFYIIAIFLILGQLSSIKIDDWTSLFTLAMLVTAVHYVIDTDKKICKICYKYLDDPLNETGIFKKLGK